MALRAATCICLDLGSARFCSSCTVFFLYILVLLLSKAVQSTPNGPKCYKLVQNLKRLKKRKLVGLQFLFDVFTMQFWILRYPANNNFVYVYFGYDCCVFAFI